MKTKSDAFSAASPVTGVILTVAITVVLAATIGVFVLDLGSNEPGENTNTEIGISITQDSNDTVSAQVKIGETSKLEVLVNGQETGENATNVTPGTVLRTTSVSPGDEVTFIAGEEKSEKIVGSYEVKDDVANQTIGGGNSSAVVVAPDTNSPPKASFSASNLVVSTLEPVTFDASGSSDDETITSYAWDFGDSSNGTNVSPSHSYPTAGNYTVTLTVTDDEGATNNTSQIIAVNSPPTATFLTDENLVESSESVTFNASGSSDSDGNISSYSWDFGDSSTGTGVSPSHAYSAGGNYNVTLTVTDNEGATSNTSQIIEANSPPNATFLTDENLVKSSESVTFDASGSSDSDGNITSYSWDFGDSSTGAGVSQSHTYSSGGDYTVKLTVTDDKGATNNASQIIEVNSPPSAAFANDDGGLIKSSESVNFDASGSSDADGTIDSYSWDFGDSTTGTGVSPSHTYSSGGDYTVKLTVTDDKGATKTTSQTIQIAECDVFDTNTYLSAGYYSYDCVIVKNSATLTLGGNTNADSNGNFGGVKITATEINVESGAKIRANGQGYSDGSGPGYGHHRHRCGNGLPDGAGGGGFYGGGGGTGYWYERYDDSPPSRGGTYGSQYDAKRLGSTGGNGCDNTRDAAGGGAIWLAADSVQIDGVISANGENGNCCNERDYSQGNRGSGGASGGAIRIEADNLSGSGTVEARGGNGRSRGGGGSGGRIALYVENDSSSISKRVDGGNGWNHGGSGTVYES